MRRLRPTVIKTAAESAISPEEFRRHNADETEADRVAETSLLFAAGKAQAGGTHSPKERGSDGRGYGAL